MKKSKIFYVSDKILERIKAQSNMPYYGLKNLSESGFENEIEISWEEQERKITITESEFNSICDDVIRFGYRKRNELKDALFSKESK